ncbi:translocon-associated protein subunit delta-like [Mizuhopecten yessoensis]|uniref:Translocon-associated protein subunit delta n=1 Tax=Mizuhopecten yessoensis TaxID=6573 RepID=A0A210PEX3_MIZYE|nr:translocon-associated protein subunit delta-like [Mizuhopecten yessoensis]OWF35043.1 Translocon-associated protein subunit delta [Mizuhopecten yessoensis]
MATTSSVVVLCCLFVLPLCVLGDTCLAPEVKTQTYTTTEAVTSTDTVFIIEFTLKCKNSVSNMNLYADIQGKTLPVTRTVTGDKYQVSFSDEHANLPSGSYNIRLFDEEGFAALRKTQRSGEDTGALKPVHTINMNHPGVWKGPFLQSEFVAATVAVFVWYLAYNARSQLQ